MDPVEQRLLLKYSRAFAHIRTQLDKGRFGLVFGAGVSKPLHFPSWGELVERIAKHSDVKGEHILASSGKALSDTAKTQMLFQHYRSKLLEISGEQLTAKIERRVQGQWRRIIHSALYQDVAKDPVTLKKQHPYLSYWIGPAKIHGSLSSTISIALHRRVARGARRGAAVEGRVWRRWRAGGEVDRHRLAVLDRRPRLPHQVVAVEGNKLTIAFDKAAEKRAVDSFVQRA